MFCFALRVDQAAGRFSVQFSSRRCCPTAPQVPSLPELLREYKNLAVVCQSLMVQCAALRRAPARRR